MTVTIQIFVLFVSSIKFCAAIGGHTEYQNMQKEEENTKTKTKDILKTYSKLSPSVLIDKRDAVPSHSTNISLMDHSCEALGASLDDNSFISDYQYLGISVNISTNSDDMFKQISSKDTCRNNSYDLGISLDSDISDVTCQKDSSSTDFHLFEEIPYSNELEREHGNDDFESSPCSIKTSTPFKSGHRDVYHFECSPIASMLSISPRITKRKTQSLTKRSLHYESNDIDCSINLDISDVLSIGLNQSSNISNPSLSNIDSNELHEVRGNIPSPSSIPSSSNNYGEPNILLFNKHTRTARILRSLKKMCCDRSCLNSLTAVDVKNMRTKYWSKSPSERRQWLFDKFTEQSRVDKNVKFLTEKGITVCQNGFLGVYDINQSVFYRNRKLFLRGVSSSVPTAFRKRTTKYLTAMNWFEDYIMFHGDRMPNINYIYLPYRTRKFVIFKQYVNELSMGKTLKRSTFYRMWENSFSNVKIKEVNSFSKCTRCTAIERQLEKTSNPIKRQKLLKLRQEHNRRQMEERKYYYRKRDAAKSSPSHYLSLIIDGMDQSKTNLPHFIGRTAKAVNPTDQLGTHITGILAHGQSRFFTYLDFKQYPHDSNLTINLLLAALVKLTEILKRRLPPILYLQADNCWRENKNKYVLAFCELLVHLKIFKEVHLSFLYVGHTHEDIDAGFSRIADTLRRNDAETMPDLLQLLPDPEQLIWMYNVRDWMDPFISDVRKHTKPLHYKFTLDQASDHVSFFYKASQQKPWKLAPSGMFLSDSNGNIHLPKGTPKVSEPILDKIPLGKMESRLNDWRCLFSDQLQHEQFNWWKQHIAYLKRLNNDIAFQKKDVLSKAKWMLNRLPKINIESPSSEEDTDPPTEIVNLLQQEVEEHDLVFGNKRKRQSVPEPRNDNIKKKKTIKQSGLNVKKKRTRVFCVRTIFRTSVGIPIKNVYKHFYTDMYFYLIETLVLLDLIAFNTLLLLYEKLYLLLWALVLERYLVFVAEININEMLILFEETTCLMITYIMIGNAYRMQSCDHNLLFTCIW